MRFARDLVARGLTRPGGGVKGGMTEGYKKVRRGEGKGVRDLVARGLTRPGGGCVCVCVCVC